MRVRSFGGLSLALRSDADFKESSNSPGVVNLLDVDFFIAILGGG
jgi:hypothetical protein